ncbi:MAG TPA: pyrroline-5-carboxylate reductase [Candidatus Eisenbacteria bacterium]|nr:pyrroline-5-carboxylate reductase [Candidatus Eisenbacteria bacterium]
MTHISIIGAGNMGTAIAKGLVSKKLVNNEQVTLTTSATKNNTEAVEKADVVIFAVKPQQLANVLQEVKGYTRTQQLFVSIAAGATLHSLEDILGKDMHIVRAMPNLAAKVSESTTVWVANTKVTEEEKKYVIKMFSSIGEEIELEKESQIDMVTVISGSGPAYFFYLVELLEKAGDHFGLPKDMVKRIAKQTLIGSAELFKNSKENSNDFRMQVTSKGGVTASAFEKFEKGNFAKLFEEGLLAAYHRAKQLNIE